LKRRIKLKKVKDLGERRIIKIVQRHLDRTSKMAVPFGDDVSAFEVEVDRLVVLKTDMLVDKTDVPPSMSLWQAARKAVVMNVSDFAAKGVKPEAALVSLGLPKDLTSTDVEDIAAGLNAGAREYDTYIIGGDTGEASDLVIAISLFGMTERGKLALRSGARLGDFVAVTGLFGNSAAGLKILSQNTRVPAEIREILVDSVLMPHARLKEGLALQRSSGVSAAIDSSDGLAWSLHEIVAASKIGITLDTLPIAKECESFASINKLSSKALALYGGEEYELVVTVKPDHWKGACVAVKKVGGSLLKIGKVTSEKGVVLKIGSERVVISPRGYEHFKS
jgi:thiamine-monophosphate kinase